uniref:CCR4-NOT transcription complex subunit 2 n=1 Tax=Calidris pygmaea TaxID=425635 RepID=A0A8C3J0K1_9CHAR
ASLLLLLPPPSSSFSPSPSVPLPAGPLRAAAGRAGTCGCACPRPSALAAGPSGGGVTAAAAGGSEGKGCSPSILRAGYSAILDPRDKKIHAVTNSMFGASRKKFVEGVDGDYHDENMYYSQSSMFPHRSEKDAMLQKWILEWDFKRRKVGVPDTGNDK